MPDRAPAGICQFEISKAKTGGDIERRAAAFETMDGFKIENVEFHPNASAAQDVGRAVVVPEANPTINGANIPYAQDKPRCKLIGFGKLADGIFRKAGAHEFEIHIAVHVRLRIGASQIGIAGAHAAGAIVIAAALWAWSEGLHHAGAALHGVAAFGTTVGAAAGSAHSHLARITIWAHAQYLQRRNIARAHWRAGGHGTFVWQKMNGITLVIHVLCLLNFAASDPSGRGRCVRREANCARIAHHRH